MLLHASERVIFDSRAEVARHERLATRGGFCLDLDHYLEALLRKPGVLPGATALEQARWPEVHPVHDAWWAAVRKARGDAAGTRTLIEVLLLHRAIPREHVVAGIAALAAGALTADAVAVKARKAAQSDSAGTVPPDVPDLAAILAHQACAGAGETCRTGEQPILFCWARGFRSLAAYGPITVRCWPTPPAWVAIVQTTC